MSRAHRIAHGEGSERIVNDSESILTSRNGDTPTIPCGVTVDVSLRHHVGADLVDVDARSVERGPPAGPFRRSRTANAGRRDAPSASPTPWAPSTRKRRSSSRNARFFRRTAAATFGFLTDVSTAPSPTSRCPRSTGSGLRQLAAGSADFAVSTSEANAAGSFTARSARILRSTSTPAVLSPLMNREYERPCGRTASVDAGDPEPAELRLAIPAVAVRVVAGVHDLFFGHAVARVAAPRVALGLLEDLAALLLRVDGSFHPGHAVMPPTDA